MNLLISFHNAIYININVKNKTIYYFITIICNFQHYNSNKKYNYKAFL